MFSKGKNTKLIMIFAGIAVVVIGIIILGITLTKDVGKSSEAISVEKATQELNDLYKNVSVNVLPPQSVPLTDLGKPDVGETLPSIDKYPPQVENTTESFVEIFSSTEKAGTNKDGWLNEIANQFNNAGIQVNGRPISVRIRGIASGIGMDYIVSGNYVPDAFTPSNELWGRMIEAQGTPIKMIDKRLVGNVPGILLSNAKQDELVKKYGAINLKTITEAVANNDLAMGYTNPFASSTGLNFLVSTLVTFDSKNPLGPKAVNEFEKFQANIPFVAYTTIQMRDSALSGALEGFVMEYQTYFNSADLFSSYVFTPFGVRHDSPLYEIGNLTSEKKEILQKFNDFCKSANSQQLGTDYGFNKLDSYKPAIAAPSGSIITSAQKLWKEKKDASKPISAVFCADVSGSMGGDALMKLKESLLKGSQYIGKDSSVGLVSFSNDVNINLPIGKFDLTQRSLFAGAVESLEASGQTSMFDAIVVAMKMLIDEKAKKPNSKLMLFVLSDGESNKGSGFDDLQNILKAFKIPVYTIGYNKDISVLQRLSSINEAASINAESDDVIYKLGSLFNAQM